LPEALIKQDVEVSGRVVSLPKIDDQRVRFDLRLDQLVFDGVSQVLSGDPVIRLSWYRADWVPAPGESLTAVVRLKWNRGFINPGGFDYERQLFAQGVRAQGYIRVMWWLGLFCIMLGVVWLMC